MAISSGSQGVANELKDRVGGRKFSFGFSTLLTGFFVVVAALGAAYIGGVMTGRRLSTAPASMPDKKMANATDSGSRQDDRILKPQELEFARALKGEKPKSQKPKPAKPQEEPKEPDKSQARPSEGASSEVAKNEERGQAGAPENQGAQSVASGHAPAGMRDYVFQVAALKDERAVDNLRQTLEGRGLRTRAERSGKVWLVLIMARGDASRPEEITRIVREERLGEPLLRSSKPVAP